MTETGAMTVPMRGAGYDVNDFTLYGYQRPMTEEASLPEIGAMTAEEFRATWNARVVLLGFGTHSRPTVVYVAGPYRPWIDEEGIRHGIAENVQEAAKIGLELWRRGYVALVPHTLTYLAPRQQRQDGGIAGVAPETFMEGDLELVRRSDVLVLMPRWKVSKGARVEREFALELGIPVYDWADFLALDEARRGAV